MESSDPPSYILYIAVLLFLLVCSMFFSASEIAFLSASRLRIRYLAEKKIIAARRVERLIENKEFFLSVILIGNNIVNVGTSALITALALSLFGNHGVGIAVAVSTVILLIFGEILPKSVALLRSESIALRLSLPLSILFFIARPIVFVLGFFTRFIKKLLGKNLKEHETAVTEEDIKNLIEDGEEEGLIQSEKRSMMHKILRYTDLTMRELMIPRTDIAAIPINSTYDEILTLSQQSPFSRFPVYNEDIDDILGILYIKDLLFAPAFDPKNFNLKNFLRPAIFVFESGNISYLQALFKKQNSTIALIIDEYGGTAGLVTTEDLVDEIFGEKKAEFDSNYASHSKTETDETLPIEPFKIEGSERLETLSETIGISLNSRFYDTIAGFILESFDDIPEPGTSITEQGFTFTVIEIHKNRIETVLVTPPEEDVE